MQSIRAARFSVERAESELVLAKEQRDRADERLSELFHALPRVPLDPDTEIALRLARADYQRAQEAWEAARAAVEQARNQLLATLSARRRTRTKRSNAQRSWPTPQAMEPRDRAPTSR